MQTLTLPTVDQVSGSVKLPGSKSISNRVLLLAALAEGTTTVRDLLDSDDTNHMINALRQLGVVINPLTENTYLVHGCNGNFPVKQTDLFLGNAGTAFRPLTATLALMPGHYTLSGVARMHERPIGDLIDALRMLGAQIEYVGQNGYPPLKIEPARTTDINEISVRGDVSSQFLTALLMALPLTGQAMSINVTSELISRPYVDITLNLMGRFGIEVERISWQHFKLPANAHYCSPGVIDVEGDASSASYFLAAGALGGGPVYIQGVGHHSIQGDILFAQALQQLGVNIEMGEHWLRVSAPAGKRLKAFDFDANHIPDAAMTLAVMALSADGPCTLKNIASWRVKETDRINAMATELRKLGAQVTEGEDYLHIVPPEKLTPDVKIDTYDDHRMAMCFSLVSLMGVPVTINDPDCVAKTFPDYFQIFRSLTGTDEP